MSAATLWRAASAAPFYLNAEVDPSKRQVVDLAGWQAAAGSDSGSRWQAPVIKPEDTRAAKPAPIPGQTQQDF